MRVGLLKLVQAAAALLLFSAVRAQEDEDLRGGASAVASHGETAGDPGASVEAARFIEGRPDLLGTIGIPQKETDGVEHEGPSISPVDASEGPRFAADRGPPGLLESETTEWIQLVMDEERMLLTSKSVGRFLPRPPVSLQPRLSRSVPNTGRIERLYGGDAAGETSTEQRPLQGIPEGRPQRSDGDRRHKEASEEDTPSSPDAQGSGLFAEERLEVPSLVELVIEVERLERGVPVFYAFRWGKPASWMEYDYLLEVREEGVYKQVLREPLMFGNTSKRQFLHGGNEQGDDPAIFPRVKVRGSSDSAADSEGFQRVEGATGCRLDDYQADLQQKSGDYGFDLGSQGVRGWPELQGLKGPRLRQSSVPLYYSVESALPRGGPQDAYRPMTFIQHSICLVFSGPPMLQLLPLEGLKSPQQLYRPVEAGGPPGAQRGPPLLTSLPGRPHVEEPAALAEGYSVDGGQQENEAFEWISKKRGLMCIIVSQLPILDAALQPSPLLVSRSTEQGAPPLYHKETQKKRAASLQGPTSFMEETGLVLQGTTDPNCEPPYTEYVYFMDPLKLSSKAFNPQQATEACNQAWALRDSDRAAAAPFSIDSSAVQKPHKASCLKGLELRQGLGRQLVQAPSVTFVWKQMISLSDVEAPGGAEPLSPSKIPDALWDLMRTGQSPCILLGFKGWNGGSPSPPTVSSPGSQGVGEETINSPFLNSCRIFASAMDKGLVLSEGLLESGGVSWELPQELMPVELVRGAGSVIYHIQLFAPTGDTAFLSPAQGGAQEPQLNLKGPASDLQQASKLWLLHQAFEIQEPGYGAWHLRLRRQTEAPPNSREEPSRSAADALTFFVMRRSCRAVIADAIRRSRERLVLPWQQAAPTAEKLETSGPPVQALHRTTGTAQIAEASRALASPRQEKHLETSGMVDDGLPSQAQIRPSSAMHRRNNEGQGLDGGIALRSRRGEHRSLEGLREDCRWCSTAIEAFTRHSGLKPYIFRLSFAVGAVGVTGDSPAMLSTSREIRRLSAEEQGITRDKEEKPAAAPRWRAVGSPVLTSLTLTPSAASGGRRLSVFVDALPFAASTTRQCAPLLGLGGLPTALGALGARRLYFYSLDLHVARDAAPHQTPHLGLEAEDGAARRQGLGAGGSLPLKKASLRLPVFCEDPDGSGDVPFGASAQRPLPTSSGARGWTFQAELLPADWTWQPTTYLLQWQLLETENSADELAWPPPEDRNETELQRQGTGEPSNADVWLRLVASSDVSTFCSKPCPSRGSCAIIDRLDGFAVFGCRCAYGYSGANCEYEYMSMWLRVLAQVSLVLSNLAILPSLFLCMRLAVRHYQGISGACPICCSIRRHQQPKNGLRGLWQQHGCFVLHTARALAYFSAFFWSVLYHACVDASAWLPLEAQTLQCLEQLFSYYSLFVTAMALADIGSSAAELVGLAGVLALMGCMWLPETFESRNAVPVVTACAAVPLISFAVRAVAIWLRAKEEHKQTEELGLRWGAWGLEDMKWLDSPKSSETERETSESPDAEERHHDLHLLLRQQMERNRERVCLDAIGQTIARLEIAGRCPMKLCFKGIPSITLFQSLRACATALWTRFVYGTDQEVPFEEGCSVSSEIQQAPITSRGVPLSWGKCLGIAVIQLIPRPEFLALGVILAVFGLGCLGFKETNDNYWLLHSLWHITIQSATCFILLSRLHHPALNQREPYTSSAAEDPTMAMHACSLSETIASSQDPQKPANSRNRPAPLAGRFWRALQQSQSQLDTLHVIRQSSGDDPSEEPQQQHLLDEGLPPYFLPDSSFFSSPSGTPSASTLQQFLPALVWLLTLQYTPHKQSHGGSTKAEEQPPPDEDECMPSPSDGDERPVRVGTAAARNHRLPSPANGVGSLLPTESTASDYEDWSCLWCIAEQSLNDEALLRVQEQRLRWACRLRLSSALSFCLLPLGFWSPSTNRTERESSPAQSAQDSIVFCS